MHPISAVPAHQRALEATADLLGRLKLDHVFAGEVARSAWLGTTVASGSIDAIAILSPQQKNQVAMMASNRGFDVDRSELEATAELDLIPLKHEGVRVHVLVASNALYGRLVAEGVTAAIGEQTLRVPRIEDFALLLQMSNDVSGLKSLAGTPEFDRDRYNRKLVSIGLGEMVLPG